MYIAVNIEEEDYWKYNKYSMTKRPKMRRAFLVNFFGIHLTIFMMMLLLKEPLKETILATIFLGIIADILVVVMFRRNVMKAAKTQRGLLGRHRFEVNESGISDQTEEHHTFISWADVTELGEDEWCFYIFSGMNFAHIVPKRGFETNDGAQEFFQEVNQLWRK